MTASISSYKMAMQENKTVGYPLLTLGELYRRAVVKTALKNMWLGSLGFPNFAFYPTFVNAAPKNPKKPSSELKIVQPREPIAEGLPQVNRAPAEWGIAKVAGKIVSLGLSAGAFVTITKGAQRLTAKTPLFKAISYGMGSVGAGLVFFGVNKLMDRINLESRNPL